MPFELTIAEGSGRGRRFRFGAVEVTIGRAPENDLLLVEPGVSRSHARIRAEGPGHVLLDEGSRNGTVLNGMPVRAAVALSPGDRIGIGPVVFQYAPGRRPGVPCPWMLRAARAAAGYASRRRLVAAWALVCVACGTAWCLLVAAGASARGHDLERAPAGHAAAEAGAVSRGDRDGAAGTESTPAPPRGRAEDARGWYERGRRKLEERRVAPRNLYDAWTSFTTAQRLLHGQQLPQALEALPRLAEAAEQDLARECRDLLFAARRFARYAQERRAQAAYREVLLRFPGNDPSGCREQARQELATDDPGEESAG